MQRAHIRVQWFENTMGWGGGAALAFRREVDCVRNFILSRGGLEIVFNSPAASSARAAATAFSGSSAASGATPFFAFDSPGTAISGSAAAVRASAASGAEEFLDLPLARQNMR